MIDHRYIAKVRQRIERHEKELAGLERRHAAENAHLAAFPMGPGCGSRASRNRQGREIDSSIKRAGRAIELRQSIASDKNHIENYAAGLVTKGGRKVSAKPKPKPRPKPARIRCSDELIAQAEALKDRLRALSWDALERGEYVLAGQYARLELLADLRGQRREGEPGKTMRDWHRNGIGMREEWRKAYE